jgi:hypothetical protein
MNSRRLAMGIGGLAFLATLASASAWAKDLDEEIEEIDEVTATNFDDEKVFYWRSSPWIRFRLDGDIIPDADFGSADVTSTRVKGTVKLLIPASDQLAFRVTIRSGAAFYDFDGDKQFLDTGRSSGDPFDDLIETVFSIETGYQLNDTWALLGRSFLNSRHEDDASFGSGIRGGGMVGASYHWQDRLRLIAGAGVGSRLAEGGVKIAPVFQVKWKINDRFELVADGLQREGQLNAKITEAFRLSAFGGIKGKSYRLEDRGGAIGKGIVRDQRKFVGLRGEWRITPRWRVRTDLGSILDQELKIEDDDGGSVDETHSDGLAFFSSLRVEYRFGR